MYKMHVINNVWDDSYGKDSYPLKSFKAQAFWSFYGKSYFFRIPHVWKDIIVMLDVVVANTLIYEDLCSFLLVSLLSSCLSFQDILLYGFKEFSLMTIYGALSLKNS